MNIEIEYKIKEIREKKNISQEKLSKLTNISISTIVRIEQNKYKNTNIINLIKIALSLNVSINDLFYIKN